MSETQPRTNPTRTSKAHWRTETYRNLACEFVDLSGDHLGVRLERIPPGQSSSYHHFHTAEEEHVYVLDGTGMLVRGEEETALAAGDHVWFPAGVPEPHHIVNRSDAWLTYLVFGERLSHDVVVYPEHDTMLVKGLGRKAFRVEPLA